MVELTESIKKVGLLEPLVVREKNGKYEVVCGIRRYRALGHIDNGRKVPVNVVKVDDHQAMVLSFTENFERVGFSPVEEARFFYNALEIKEDFKLKVSQDSPEIKQLSKDIPTSAMTIAKRLYLLALPEQVQNMLEADDLKLTVAEQISRLRRIEDSEFREKKMLQYAQDYSGEKPNLEKLNDDINKELNFEKDRRQKDKEKLKEYIKLEKQRKKELIETLTETVVWYNEQFENGLEADVEQVDSIINKLQEQSSFLTTDTEFNKLVKQQIETEDRIKNLEINLNIVRKKHLSICPFCSGFVNVSKVKSMIKNLNDDVDSLKNQQKNISVVKQKIEGYRENLRKAHLAWMNVCELIEKENGGEEVE